MAGSMYHYVPPAPGPKALPILISCPHVGTEIPDDIAGRLTQMPKKTCQTPTGLSTSSMVLPRT